MLPMIAVPRPPGTGSEAQSFALITGGSRRKMACGDRRATCRIALLDPELTLTQPPRVTAVTGIDAISHAAESYVQTAQSLSICYSRQAWQLLGNYFPWSFNVRTIWKPERRSSWGAYFAGLAIETSMLGAAHAMANPLTAQFGVTHGQAVGLMLPQVIRFNGQQVGQWYEDLWRDVASTPIGRQCSQSQDGGEPQNYVELLADFVCRLVQLSGLETQLRGLGIAEESLDALATEATHQWTGSFNPRSLTEADFRELYLRTLNCREAS